MQSACSHHNDDTEGAGRLLFVHPVEQVIADDVDEAGAKAVSACNHHINAVGSDGRQPSPESLRERARAHFVLRAYFSCVFQALLRKVESCD